MKKIVWHLLFTIAFFACGNDEENLKYEFHYKNNTAHQVKIIVYGKYILTANESRDTLTLMAYQDMPTVMSSTCVGNYCKGVDNEPFRGLADSARIVFSENKEVFFTTKGNNDMNVLYSNSYSKRKEGDKLILEYITSDELYRQAK